jgi:hypothetical protein
MPQEEEFEFEDMENYHGSNEKLSFKIIVMQQLSKIGSNANVELRGGYWVQRIVPTASGEKITEEYIPDTREVYSNSIEYLHDILYPHFQKDKEMKKASDEYIKAIEKALDKYMQDGKFTDEEKVLYRDERVKICRELFVEINCFLERKNYFSERVI